jgi:hypothetical protein
MGSGEACDVVVAVLAAAVGCFAGAGGLGMACDRASFLPGFQIFSSGSGKHRIVASLFGPSPRYPPSNNDIRCTPKYGSSAASRRTALRCFVTSSLRWLSTRPSPPPTRRPRKLRSSLRKLLLSRRRTLRLQRSVLSRFYLWVFLKQGRESGWSQGGDRRGGAERNL